ncbi:MAG: hypothetical protein QM703_17525 [Gemmatales bacterium]
MTKQLLSKIGVMLFILGFLFTSVGAFIVWGTSGSHPFLLPGIGLGLILASFGLMAWGSRVSNKTE